jgi:hypothetical protein
MEACPVAHYGYSTAPGTSPGILLQNRCFASSARGVARLCSGHVPKVNLPIGFRLHWARSTPPSRLRSKNTFMSTPEFIGIRHPAHRLRWNDRNGPRLCENACAVLKSALLRKICQRLVNHQIRNLRRSAIFVPSPDCKTCSKMFSHSLDPLRSFANKRSAQVYSLMRPENKPVPILVHRNRRSAMRLMA